MTAKIKTLHSTLQELWNEIKIKKEDIQDKEFAEAVFDSSCNVVFSAPVNVLTAFRVDAYKKQIKARTILNYY
jgi:hypothetical protein